MSNVEVLITGTEVSTLRSRVNLNRYTVGKLNIAGIPATLDEKNNIVAARGTLTKATHPQFPLSVLYTWKPLLDSLRG
jgi:hypothetical protein